MTQNPARNIAGFAFTALLFGLISCQKDGSNSQRAPARDNVKIQFKGVVGADNLSRAQSYKNPFGEDYSVDILRFYVHGIEVVSTQTNKTEKLDKANHYLIDLLDPVNSYVQVSLPEGTYDRIVFVVGVDSIRNVSGAQTGALDPAKGMFWTWSTGYIMAKLEGKSPVANTPNNVIEYHIGGFKGNESVLRKIVRDVPAGQALEIKNGRMSVVTITSDVNAWFGGTYPIRISQKPVSMTPGLLATQIADNYGGMFSVAAIVNE